MSDGIVRIEELGCDEFLCVTDSPVSEESGKPGQILSHDLLPNFIAGDGTWVKELRDAAKMKSIDSLSDCLAWLEDQGIKGYPVKGERRPIEHDGVIIDVITFHNMFIVED